MPTAYLTTLGMKVSVTSERLEIDVPKDKGGEEVLPERRWIPLVDVEFVVLDAGVRLSSRSLTALLRRRIPVLYLSHGRMPAGMALPLNRFATIKARQLDGSRDPDLRLRFSKELVFSKINNQKRVIQRLAANRKQPPVAAAWLNSMANQALAAASVDSLRGIEGAASGRYFETLAGFFPEDLPFEGRSRRPPKNPPNALLSFGYTLLVSELSVHLHACGLEPSWGLYHETEDGRPALALDLLEPFRAPVIDGLCLDILNHRQLQRSDFEEVNGGVLLKRTSRRKFFAALERRLERDFLSEQAGHRTSLRQVMRDHCLAVKKLFSEGTLFRPFLMN